MILGSAITARSLVTSGQTASNLVCDVGAVTCTRSAPRKRIYLPSQHAATAGGRKGKPTPRQLKGLQTREGGDAGKKSRRTPRTTTGRVFSSNLTTPGMSFAAALPGSTEEQQQPQIHQVAVGGPATMAPSLTPTRTIDNRSFISGP
jgi:hypothetical protein